MTDAEKIAAFDNIATMMINQWGDGRYGWYLPSPGGGPTFETHAEALADFIKYAERVAPQQIAKQERKRKELK